MSGKSMRFFALLVAASVGGLALAASVGTDFTYQGQLLNAGAPVSGTCDLRFTLYDAAAAGSAVAGPLTRTGVAVSGGLFTTTIDFGAGPFAGDARWLLIEVRCGAEPGFTSLSPRQALTTVPYSTHSAGPWKTTGADHYVDAGRVGIGTSTPQAALHLRDAIDAPGLRMTGDSSMVNDEVWGEVGVYQGASVLLGRTFWRGQGSGNPDFTVDTRFFPGALTVDGSTGRVGINTAPASGLVDERLHVVGDVKIVSDSDVTTTLGTGALYVMDSAGTSGLHLDMDEIQSIGGQLLLNNSNTGNVRVNNLVHVLTTGLVGIGTSVPAEKLDVAGDLRIVSSSDVGTGSTSGALYVTDGGVQSLHIDSNEIQALGGPLQLNLNNVTATSLNNYVHVTTGGNVGIGTASPTSRLTVVGATRTESLTITGGSDLSERFHVGAGGGRGEIVPGLVVSIDPDEPGRLVVSGKAYDRAVAGVISGAGGVRTGLLMGQEGSIADGNHPVALTGRVYVWADATERAIRPGDLLTTSETAGHAMAADDPARAAGAILGKAMTPLADGRGLVLALVALQ